MTTTYYPASPIAIRDGTVTRLQALGLFSNVFKARTQPTKDDQLPLACVWHAGERTQPNGDANTGAPSFLHTLTLAVDVMTKAGSEADLDTEILALIEQTRAALMTDLTWVGLFEGIERCDVRFAYPKETNNFFVQAILEIEVTFRSIWQPLTPNDLTEVAVFARPPRAPITCGLCHTPNPGDWSTCSVCQGALPRPPDPILTTINLKACP